MFLSLINVKVKKDVNCRSRRAILILPPAGKIGGKMSREHTHYIIATLAIMFFCFSTSILKAENPAINSSDLSGEKVVHQDQTKSVITNDITIGESGADNTKLSGITGVINYIRQNTLGANIKIILKSDYNPAGETYPIIFNANMNASNYSITVCPEANLTVTVNNSETIYKLDGAKNLILDGRINAQGNDIGWVISNTNTTGSAIKLINYAHNDTLRYLKVMGVNTNSSNGVITFAQSTSSATYGSNYNTVEYCEVFKGASYPLILIHSSGYYQKPNSFNTIRHCKLSGNSNIIENNQSIAISIHAYANNWTVSDNHIFQADSIQVGSISNPSAYVSGYGIYIDDGGGHYVHHNYIGGNGPYCAGTLKITSGSKVNYTGISVNATINNPSITEYNTVQNIRVYTAYSDESATGICLMGNASSINYCRNNTIKNITIIDSDSSTICGIRLLSSGTINCQNNLIDSLLIYSLNNNKTTKCYGIQANLFSTGGSNLVEKNVIRNISAGSSTSTQLNIAGGIYIQRGLGMTGINNEISNIKVKSINSNSYIFGIKLDIGTNNIYNNMLCLGEAIENPYKIYGIYDKAGNNNYYYNSLNVLGNYNSNSGSSYCFYSDITPTVAREIKNNLFYNQRSGSGSKNYALKMASLNNTVLDYNNYKSEICGNYLGNISSFEDWQIATSQDEHSKSFIPAYIANDNLHLSSVAGNINYIGIPVSTVSTDFDGETRNLNTPFLGADERPESLTLPVELSSFMGSMANSSSVTLQWITQSESNMMGYHVYRSETEDLSQADRMTTNIIPAQNLAIEHQYNFEDKDITGNCLYNYWLMSYEMDGSTNSYGPVQILTTAPGAPTTPEVFETGGLAFYPNPFNPSGTVSFSLAEKMHTEVSIYNVKGQKIITLVNLDLDKGKHLIPWNGKDKYGVPCATGVYFYQINTRNYSEIKKIMLLK